MSEEFMLLMGIVVSLVLGVVWWVEAFSDKPLTPRHKDVLVGITVLFAIAVINAVISAAVLLGSSITGEVVNIGRLLIRGLLLTVGIYAGVRLWVVRGR